MNPNELGVRHYHNSGLTRTAIFRRLCGVLALLAAAFAQASQVTYFFGGQLNYVDTQLTPSFAAGSQFSGSFTYESTTPDNAPLDPDSGYYLPGPPFSITLNGITVSHTGGGGGSVAVLNDLGGTDQFSVNALGVVTNGTVANGYVRPVFILLLEDISASAFASDALPSAELNLDSFSYSSVELSFFNLASDNASVRGQLNYLSLTNPNTATGIPEPGSLAMLALGLYALGYTAKRRRPHHSGECQE